MSEIVKTPDIEISQTRCYFDPTQRRGSAAHYEEDRILSQITSAVNADAASQTSRIMKPEATSEELRDLIVDILNDAKAEDLVTIGLHGKSTIADYMVICSGRSSRQVSAMAEKVVDTLKAELGRLSKVEGKTQGDWVLIDTGDVVVHLFRPEVRDFYQLEKMWMAPPSAS